MSIGLMSKKSGLNDAAYGKIETPLRMVIQHESDALAKKQEYVTKLFVEMPSKRFAETIVGGNEFGDFEITGEGEGAKNDSVEETYRAIIRPLQFTKEFAITAEMIEDANYGLAADARRKAEDFTRAYYRTQTRFSSALLVQGTKKQMIFNGTTYDIGAPRHANDTAGNQPLFYNAHNYGAKGASTTQSNYFYDTNLANAAAGNAVLDEVKFEALVDMAAFRIFNMKDENGNALGYAADTLVLPANRQNLARIAKKVFASFQLGGGTGGTNLSNNLLYNAMTLIIDPFWQADKNEFILMSSEANKALGGNVFVNRVGLDLMSWVDKHTRNLITNGRSRFGVGNGSYKHIVRVTEVNNAAGASALED